MTGSAADVETELSGAGPQRIRVFIVDDHPLVREGLKARLSMSANLEVCGEAPSGSEARAGIEACDPALVIVDLVLKDSDGIDLIKRLRASGKTCKVLVVSAFDAPLYVERALRAGANGYVNKREVAESIIEAIEFVLAGRLYLSAEIARALAERATIKDRRDVEELSDRELQVLSLIGTGMTTREVAVRLHLSVHTIESHRERLRHKLGLKNGAELARYAVRWVFENSHGDSRAADDEPP